MMMISKAHLHIKCFTYKMKRLNSNNANCVIYYLAKRKHFQKNLYQVNMNCAERGYYYQDIVIFLAFISISSDEYIVPKVI